MSLLVETTVGNFTVDLFTEDSPQNCFNFIKLAKLNYFSFCNFFSVEKDFIAICGDRESCDGTANGITVFSLINPTAKNTFIRTEYSPKRLHTKKGTISILSHGGLHRNTSIFFVTLADDLNYLDEQHTVIGRISDGIEILDLFNKTIVDSKNRPFEDIVIKRMHVLHDPFKDPDNFFRLKPFILIPSVAKTRALRIGWMDEIEQEKTLSAEQIRHRIEQRELRSKSFTLEILGDIPSQDAAPSDNVLFVCKLNPITQEQDLKLIFSRFGKITKCNIVKDKQSYLSLGYAFIEFEEKKSCEQAYLKMDNAIIDEKRIHVDFSHSVKKTM